MIEKLIKELENKHILILGFGREGKSALNFIRKNIPEAHVTIADSNAIDIPGEECIFGEDYLKACSDADIIIKSPGVIIKDFIPEEQRAKITCTTDLFMKYYHMQTIGITGTKGKSTTSSIIAHILKECGRDVILAGNIGKPVFDILDDIKDETTIVLEMSSHQLEFAKYSPHIAVLLNIYEEHLDHYLTPQAYFDAKKNIFKHQNAEDYLLYGDIFQHCTREEFEAAPSQKIDIFLDIDISPEDIKTQLLGDNNRQNIITAIKACELAGVDRNDALKAAESFKALPHRLQFIGNYKNIDFYDDSIATAQEATINAIESIPNVDTVILGGMDRGLDYHILVDFLRQSKVRNVILLPDTHESIGRIFNEAPFSQRLFVATDMEQAVQIAYQETAENHSCVLSPAAASYGFFKNFEERGEKFQELVKKYATLELNSLT